MVSLVYDIVPGVRCLKNSWGQTVGGMDKDEEGEGKMSAQAKSASTHVSNPLTTRRDCH